MHDLRRQALESKKTVSKKAQSRVSSRTSSAPHSRNQSRHGSDDEDDNLSDGTNFSVNSIDNILNSEDIPDTTEEEEATGAWKQDIVDRVEEIINRKGSTVQGRELALTHYAHTLMHHYALDDIQHKTGELYPALLKSIKAEDSEKETCLALRAVVLTIITTPSETVYEAVFQTLKAAYRSSEFHNVKAMAIHALSGAAMYGGASDTEIEEIMDELLEVIESDGSSIGADDSGPVVAAACEAWGFLATMVDDIEEKIDTAMDAFMEQLESSEVSVQVAAGENIALLYEKSYFAGESDSESDDGEEEDDGSTSTVPSKVNFRQQNELMHLLTKLANESSRRIAKKDRRTLHTNFADIVKTIEDPSRGPRYQTAIDQETGGYYGSRMTVRIAKMGSMKIDRWWKLHRLSALRRILGGGFAVHYQNNEVVFESLPIIIMADDEKTQRKPKEKVKRKGGSKALRHQLA